MIEVSKRQLIGATTLLLVVCAVTAPRAVPHRSNVQTTEPGMQLVDESAPRGDPDLGVLP